MAHSIPLLLLSWILIVGSCSPTVLEAHSDEPKSLNAIDDCWRKNPNWAESPQSLADCAKGYGAEAQGGKNGPVYWVTDPSDDDPINPKNGTLRYGAIQKGPLWIVFEKDMNIKLKAEMDVSSNKTIDGRGTQVRIGDGPCLRINKAAHVIIHGLTLENCSPVNSGPIPKLGKGDGIAVVESSHVWIDHCSVSKCEDGLIDVTHASSFVTISNNFLSDHRKVMLLGHSDWYPADKDMMVTLVFNYFGPRLVERMPRVRFGYAHVANNKYEKWLNYAIGGSMHPTILSEGNYFDAPNDSNSKDVTWRKLKNDGDWKSWSWSSKNDAFLNGAYFNESGTPWMPSYSEPQSFAVAPADQVVELTGDAGALDCERSKPCLSDP